MPNAMNQVEQITLFFSDGEQRHFSMPAIVVIKMPADPRISGLDKDPAGYCHYLESTANIEIEVESTGELTHLRSEVRCLRDEALRHLRMIEQLEQGR